MKHPTTNSNITTCLGTVQRGQALPWLIRDFDCRSGYICFHGKAEKSKKIEDLFRENRLECRCKWLWSNSKFGCCLPIALALAVQSLEKTILTKWDILVEYGAIKCRRGTPLFVPKIRRSIYIISNLFFWGGQTDPGMSRQFSDRDRCSVNE